MAETEQTSTADSAEKAYAAAAEAIEAPAAIVPEAPAKARRKPVSRGPQKAPRTSKTRTSSAASNSAAGSTLSQLKDKIMAKTTPDFTEGFKTVVADAQAKAQEAFEKGSAALGEAGEFAKGNVEALVESGKIFASGIQELSTGLVAEAKSAFETATADAKELATLKSPADLLKLQSELMRRNFDAAIAFGSKNSEAMMKLANEAFAPISGRVSLAVDKIKKAA